MESLISVPLNKLSPDKASRHAQLRNYFCDKDAIATQVGDEWHLKLEWSNDPYRYIDPRLSEGLSWWGVSSCKLNNMAEARKRNGRVLLCLNDTWTLQSWSEWLAREANKSTVVILHVDDHKDLGSPRLFLSDDGWLDPITGQSLDLMRPSSIESAIKSGALGMGSFLTPFLHHMPNTDVRHLCQPPKCSETTDYAITLGTTQDLLLSENSVRPSVILNNYKNNECIKSNIVNGRYRFTNNIDNWLEGLDSQTDNDDTAILLHIDMDYFCNRFDGDSEALYNPKPLNTSLPEVMNKIDELTAALREKLILKRIDDIAIAFSPGFFPAEFWEKSCERLLEGLDEY